MLLEQASQVPHSKLDTPVRDIARLDRGLRNTVDLSMIKDTTRSSAHLTRKKSTTTSKEDKRALLASSPSSGALKRTPTHVNSAGAIKVSLKDTRLAALNSHLAPNPDISLLRNTLCNILYYPPFTTTFSLIQHCTSKELHSVLTSIITFAVDQFRIDNLLLGFIEAHLKANGSLKFPMPQIQPYPADCSSNKTGLYYAEIPGNGNKTFEPLMMVNFYLEQLTHVPRKLSTGIQKSLEGYENWEESSGSVLNKESFLGEMIASQFPERDRNVILSHLLSALEPEMEIVKQFVYRFPSEIEDVYDLLENASSIVNHTCLSAAEKDDFVFLYLFYPIFYRSSAVRARELQFNNITLMQYVLLRSIIKGDFMQYFDIITREDQQIIEKIKERFSEIRSLLLSGSARSFEDQIASFSALGNDRDISVGFSVLCNAVLSHFEKIWSDLVDHGQADELQKFLPFVALSLRPLSR